MQTPQSPDDLKNEIYQSSDKFERIGDLRIRQLLRILPNVSEELIVEAVVSIFEDQTRISKSLLDQELAGKVLAATQAKSIKDPKELVRRALVNWNKSIEQFPFWLKHNYDIETIENVIGEMQKHSLTDMELDKIRTLRWWMTNRTLLSLGTPKID